MAERKGSKMNSEESRQSEKERRESAQQGKGKVIAGSGRPLEGRKLDQMVSLRLDPAMVTSLREIAESNGIGVSDLIREAIADWLSARNQAQFDVSFSLIDTGFSMYGATSAIGTASRVRESRKDYVEVLEDVVFRTYADADAGPGRSRPEVLRSGKS
jgi:uncharacterized protein (DUF4415 family)